MNRFRSILILPKVTLIALHCNTSEISLNDQILNVPDYSAINVQPGCVVHMSSIQGKKQTNTSNFYMEILYSRSLAVNMTRLKTKIQAILLLAVCRCDCLPSSVYWLLDLVAGLGFILCCNIFNCSCKADISCFCSSTLASMALAWASASLASFLCLFITRSAFLLSPSVISVVKCGG